MIRRVRKTFKRTLSSLSRSLKILSDYRALLLGLSADGGIIRGAQKEDDYTFRACKCHFVYSRKVLCSQICMFGSSHYESNFALDRYWALMCLWQSTSHITVSKCFKCARMSVWILYEGGFSLLASAEARLQIMNKPKTYTYLTNVIG